MANLITVLNESTGQYYTIQALLEQAVLAPGLAPSVDVGADTYYIRVTTTQRDVYGNVIPDQIIQPTDPTAFTTSINAAMVSIMELVAGLGSSSSSMSFSSAST